MAFSIDKFRSSFLKSGEPASPANYEVEIFRKVPDLVVNTITGAPKSVDLTLEDLLKYRCISCSLPGKMLTTVERSTYGPNRKIATSAFYEDVMFSFIISDNSAELNYFHNWMNLVTNNIEAFGVSVNDVAYYDDYVTDTFITQFTKAGKPSRKIKLEESYPINIQSVPMGWEMSNDIMKVDVTMAYRNWHTVNTNT
jgi:hypothetical protein